MPENKTKPSTTDVTDFLEAIEHPTRRADGLALNALFKDVTGWTPQMWGPTMVGYGSYTYAYETGHGGTFLATGFSPRKANLSIYIMPGYQEYGEILGRLGKHKMGKSCLYVTKLADIDMDVLAELVRKGLGDLGQLWPVEPS